MWPASSEGAQVFLLALLLSVPCVVAVLLVIAHARRDRFR